MPQPPSQPQIDLISLRWNHRLAALRDAIAFSKSNSTRLSDRSHLSSQSDHHYFEDKLTRI
ncbi:MAG: hypothetical protein LDL41_13305 [Coleofasciculus sp. S288]|nr:hypothetical protein [Coleofasciculus sp. S288]